MKLKAIRKYTEAYDNNLKKDPTRSYKKTPEKLMEIVDEFGINKLIVLKLMANHVIVRNNWCSKK
jgi:DNA transposition AAA+ family ATPase